MSPARAGAGRGGNPRAADCGTPRLLCAAYSKEPGEVLPLHGYYARAVDSGLRVLLKILSLLIRTAARALKSNTPGQNRAGPGRPGSVTPGGYPEA